MGKNSGTTRSGGSSNPKGAGEPMNTYADFKNSQRLNDMVAKVKSFVDELKKGDAEEIDINSALMSGLAAVDAYEKAAMAAARGLRSGRLDAEDRIDEIKEEMLTQLYNQHDKAAKAIVRRKVNHSWTNYWLADLEGLVKKTTSAQEFVLEPAVRGGDVSHFSLFYSSNRNRYVILREQDGKNEAIDESMKIDEIVKLAKERGLMAVGVRRKSDRRF